MNRLLGLGFAAALTLSLLGCNDDDHGSQTVSKLAREEIATNSSETSEPILLNDLSLSSKDTNETAMPDAL